MDNPYYWFFVNSRTLGLRIFFNDLLLVYYGLSNYFSNFSNIALVKFCVAPFFYWTESSYTVGFTQFKKHNIRDYFIQLINTIFYK